MPSPLSEKQIYSLPGYEDLVGKLRQLGADIRVEEIPEPEETEAHIC